MNYSDFVESKLAVTPPTGLDEVPELHASLFPHQRDLITWALRRGRCAIFADTGLGKSSCEIEWARVVSAHTKKPVLILTPLAVAQQMRAEGERLGVNVSIIRDAEGVQLGVNVCNYDRIHKLDPARFGGVVLDESSVIKHQTSKRFQQLTEAFAATPFRLCATATPAPNDHTELGTHAEFLGICSRTEMLAEYFCHDGGETQVWRLKKHARAQFWRWVASWGALLRKPSDLGYETAGYDLPALDVVQHVIPADIEQTRAQGLLFAEPAKTLTEQRQARRTSLSKRVAAAVERVRAEPNEPFVVWCDLNDEQDAIAEALGDECVSVYGSLDIEAKELRISSFINGSARVLVSKTAICGFGLNMQRAARMAFVGVSHSFESYYQAIRRIWRFGQKRPCVVHVIISELEGDVLANLQRKQADAITMSEALSVETREMVRSVVRGSVRSVNVYSPGVVKMPAWLRSEADSKTGSEVA